MKPAIIFDIETAPLTTADAERFKPVFEAARNIKDAAKIAAAIAEKETEWRDKLALSPLTGRVLVIGLLDGDVFTALEGDERDVLTAFWAQTMETSRDLAGHNIRDFDVPFLIRRSWALGVPVPREVGGGNRLSERYVDTMKLWACGVYGERVSLDNLGKHLGAGAKTGSGKDFAALYEADRAAALAYVEQDCRLTAKVLARML